MQKHKTQLLEINLSKRWEMLGNIIVDMGNSCETQAIFPEQRGRDGTDGDGF